MTAKLTRDWWVCLCDEYGNAHHMTVGEWLGANRLALLQGGCEAQAVALADSLDSSQAAGRIVKRQIAAARIAAADAAVAAENGGELCTKLETGNLKPEGNV